MSSRSRRQVVLGGEDSLLAEVDCPGCIVASSRCVVRPTGADVALVAELTRVTVVALLGSMADTTR